MSQMKAGRKSEAMSMLRQKGISPTHQRLEVLKYLQDYPGHPSAEEVFAALQGVEPPLSKASVYNILRLFEERGAFLCATFSPALPYARFDRAVTHLTEDEQFNGRVVFDGMIACAKAALAHGIPVVHTMHNRVDVGIAAVTPLHRPVLAALNMWRGIWFSGLPSIAPLFCSDWVKV